MLYFNLPAISSDQLVRGFKIKNARYFAWRFEINQVSENPNTLLTTILAVRI